MSEPAPRVVAVAAAKAFEAAHVPYVLAGSMASMLHGEIRGTLDVDFATLMREVHVADFLRATTGTFIFDATWIAARVAERKMFQLLHAASYVKVDVYVRPDEGLFASEIRRGTPARLGPGPEDFVKVATAEDTLLQKLRWYREGGCVSDRQWRDVCGIFKTQGSELDAAYLTKWARELDLSELLDQARAASGASPSK